MSRSIISLTASHALAAAFAFVVLSAALAKDRPPPPTLEDDRQASGCEYLGKDYMKAPGTDTCIKVSGYSRTEGAVVYGR